MEESPNKELWRKAEELLKEKPGTTIAAACKQIGVSPQVFSHYRNYKYVDKKKPGRKPGSKNKTYFQIPAVEPEKDDKAMVIIASPGMLKNILREWL